MGVDCLVTGGEAAVNLTQHACRCDADRVGLSERGLGVAHPCVELREMHVLHLHGSAAGEFVIEMLTRAAKRLPRAFSFSPQALAVRAGRLFEERAIKAVAIGGDL